MTAPKRRHPRPHLAPVAPDRTANHLDVAALVRDPATKVVVTCGSGSGRSS